jgi:hypothetical protein
MNESKNKKCDNFQTKFAFIRNKNITIDDYIKKYVNNNKKGKILCKNKHELICCAIESNKMEPYFRHKNNEDTCSNLMTEWHSEWQSNFLNTEIDFKKLNKNQIDDRRADVVIEEHNLILEFQHSKIDITEVNNRMNDYNLHNKKIIWIIDGNSFIKVTELKDSNRIYLEFEKENWKYKSFISYDCIFIDIKNNIYKVYPKEIKSDMIDVDKPYNKKEFINLLNNNDNKIHTLDIPNQSILYIKQQGAGNGKTFGLIQMLESTAFEHYKYFIIVTKQHSAKYVIFTEFQNQIKNGDLKYIKNVEKEDTNKKYSINYFNEKSKLDCQISISTIDSLMFSLGNTNHKELDKFLGIVNSIIDGYIEKTNKPSTYFNGIHLKLNKEVCLICDETQDLTIDYSKAIIQIMRNKYIDSYIVGDKLQSLMNTDNAFTYLLDNDFSYIKKDIYEPQNICRRFYQNELINFVNSIIPFKKYSLQEITSWKPDDNNESSLEIFEGDIIRVDEKDDCKINKEIEKIMEYYDKEVKNYNYKPNDFLIVTPFVSKNPLVNALDTAINLYWTNKNNGNNFERYSIFHKSEEGNSINLSDSENTTRIVSIHTSKGDGRNVVFVIGLDEKSLIKYSNESNNLISDSLIHVALTRMKKKLYVRLVNNGDDITQKIQKYLGDNNQIKKIKPNLNISKNIKFKDLIDNLKTNNNFNILKENIIDKNDSLKNILNLDDDKQVIDMGHHNIRFMSMIIFLYIKIINNENKCKDDVKMQIQTIFKKIVKELIYDSDTWQKYNNFLDDKKICILKLSKNGRDYINYFQIIKEFMKDLQVKMKDITENKINELCPFESIILYYMIQIFDEGIYSDITINELYNITDIYNKSFDKNYQGHEKCLCKKLFNKDKLIVSNEKIQKLSKYLLTHYEQIINIGKIYDKFIKIYPKINWLINHFIDFSGNNNDFKLYKTFNLIGYDDKNTYIIYLKPQFNELNYNETIIDSIYDTFLINNLRKCKDKNKDLEEKEKINKNYERFSNKNIITVIFSLNNNDFNLIEWKNDKENLININNDFLIDNVKNKIISKYIIESKYLYDFFIYWKEEFTLKNVSSDKIMKEIIKKIKDSEYYDKMPHFIIKMFETIETLISYRINKLNDFDDKDFFMEKLNKIIIESVQEFLGIETNDSS